MHVLVLKSVTPNSNYGISKLTRSYTACKCVRLTHDKGRLLIGGGVGVVHTRRRMEHKPWFTIATWLAVTTSYWRERERERVII